MTWPESGKFPAPWLGGSSPSVRRLEAVKNHPGDDVRAGMLRDNPENYVEGFSPAIEEGSILDVLQNYAQWKMLARLQFAGSEDVDTQEPDAEATPGALIEQAVATNRAATTDEVLQAALALSRTVLRIW